MKKLFLVRHAKSSWEDSSLADIERPLNKRGKRDAPFMSKLLNKKNIKIDIIYTSPAVRALTTSKIFAQELNIPQDKIVVYEKLYDSGIKELSQLINNISENHSSVLIVGHNPSLTSFANHLSDKFIDNIPTCGIVGIEFDINSWKKIERGKGKIFLFEYPKKYIK